MSYDDLQSAGNLVRQPTFSVIANSSTALTGLKAVEVTNNTHFTADGFRVALALSGLPPALGLTYWDASSGDQLEVTAAFEGGNPGTAPLSLIVGVVDDVEVDLVGRTMTLVGRDLSSRLLDAKTAETFSDQTSSDVATLLAARHGLKAAVTATTTRVGSYYQLFHARLTQEQCEWDLLTFLAQQEGFDVWVSGTTLYFQPPISDSSDPYILLWSDQGPGNRLGSFSDLQLRRSQTLAKDIIVKVRSWNQAQEKAFTATAKRIKTDKGTRAGGDAQTYTFNVPNLTQDQAQQWAEAKANDITKHERVIAAKLPGDNLLTTRSLVKLVGTGTAWDQNYYPDQITRSWAFGRGYQMTLRAKNHTTASTVLPT